MDSEQGISVISKTEIDVNQSEKEINTYSEIKEPLPPLGMKYVWGNYSVMGETDHASILRLWSKGYKPVPPDRHPTAYSDRSVPGFISRRGSVLLEISERDSRLHQARLDYINSEIDKDPLLGIKVKVYREEYVKELNAPVTPEIEIN